MNESVDNFQILVAVDFSESAMRAFQHSLGLAHRLRASIHVVHALPSSVHSPELFAHAPGELSEAMRAQQKLLGLVAIALGSQVHAHAHLRLGPPAPTILEAIDELRPDLVVLGSHGRGAVMRSLMGSVSTEVWKQSRMPTLIVPPPLAADRARDAEAVRDDDVPLARDIAWSCSGCGHIRDEVEPTDHCRKCGLQPARWNWAPVYDRPADESVEPSAGTSPLDQTMDSARVRNAPAALFSTSPPGTEGYEVNAELRIRY